MKEIKRYDCWVMESCGELQVDEEKNGDFVFYSDIEPIIEENKQMKEMLKKLEFPRYNTMIDDFCCEFCDSPRYASNGNHKPDCELAKKIGEK